MRGMAAIAIMRQGISRNGVASDRVYICIPVARMPVSSYLAFPSLPRLSRGGLFLLHFPGSRLRRTLSVILSLWSPDFPHNNTFRPHITRLPDPVLFYYTGKSGCRQVWIIYLELLLLYFAWKMKASIFISLFRRHSAFVTRKTLSDKNQAIVFLHDHQLKK